MWLGSGFAGTANRPIAVAVGCDFRLCGGMRQGRPAVIVFRLRDSFPASSPPPCLIPASFRAPRQFSALPFGASSDTFGHSSAVSRIIELTATRRESPVNLKETSSAASETVAPDLEFTQSPGQDSERTLN
jgi:hypothetical protein